MNYRLKFVLTYIFFGLPAHGCSPKPVSYDVATVVIDEETVKVQSGPINNNRNFQAILSFSDPTDVFAPEDGIVKSLDTDHRSFVKKNQPIFKYESKSWDHEAIEYENELKTHTYWLDEIYETKKSLLQIRYTNALKEEKRKNFELNQIKLKFSEAEMKGLITKDDLRVMIDDADNQLIEAAIASSRLKVEISELDQQFHTTIMRINEIKALKKIKTYKENEKYIVSPYDASVVAVSREISYRSQFQVTKGQYLLTVHDVSNLLLQAPINKRELKLFIQNLKWECSLNEKLDFKPCSLNRVTKNNVQGEYQAHFSMDHVSQSDEGKLAIVRTVNDPIPVEIRVPKNSIKIENNRSVVRVVDGDRNISSRVVDTGIADEQYVEILTGLVVGDTIISRSHN